MPPEPTHNIRLQAIVLAPSTQSNPFQLSNGKPFGGPELIQLVAGVNALYAQVGVHFEFDPLHDLAGESSDLVIDNDANGLLRAAWAAQYQGKVVLIFREASGGESSHDSTQVLCMKNTVGSSLVLHVAHELGHYFGISHTHSGSTLTTVADELHNKFLPKRSETKWTLQLLGEVQAYIENAFDGDLPGKGAPYPVNDTPLAIHEWPFETTTPEGQRARCENSLSLPIEFKGVTFTFEFTPDRSNIESYFDCPNTNKFSPEQIAIIRRLIEKENRNVLLGPVLYWSGWYEVPGDRFTDTSVGAAKFDSLHVLAKDASGSLSHNQGSLNGTNLSWGDWSEVAGNPQAAFAPAIVEFDGKLYAFLTDADGAIKDNFAPAGQPFQSQWDELPGGGNAANAPAATVFDQQLYVFVMGATGHVYYARAAREQTFQGWTEVPGAGAGKGSVAATAFDNKLYLFIAGPEDDVYHTYANPGPNFLSAWYLVPGAKKSTTSPATAALGDYLYVFIVGGEGEIWMNWKRAENEFGAWRKVPGGGLTNTTPTVAVWNNQLYLFVTGIDNQRIYVNSATPDHRERVETVSGRSTNENFAGTFSQESVTRTPPLFTDLPRRPPR